MYYYVQLVAVSIFIEESNKLTKSILLYCVEIHNTFMLNEMSLQNALKLSICYTYNFGFSYW